MTKRPAYPLRPFMPADTIGLRELFAASIEELTQEDYDEDQRIAWASMAEDAQAFAKRLGSMVTLVVQIEGEYAGFASLKDNTVLDMLFVHPYHAGEGVGSALCDALERIAAARGASEISVDASETAAPFFEDRGYVATRRNSVPVDDQWLANTTMTKKLTAVGSGRPS
jgi:putative acetyltransferase